MHGCPSSPSAWLIALRRAKTWPTAPEGSVRSGRTRSRVRGLQAHRRRCRRSRRAGGDGWRCSWRNPHWREATFRSEGGGRCGLAYQGTTHWEKKPGGSSDPRTARHGRQSVHFFCCDQDRNLSNLFVYSRRQSRPRLFASARRSSSRAITSVCKESSQPSLGRPDISVVCRPTPASSAAHH